MAVNRLNDRVIKLIEVLGVTPRQFAISLGYERADKIYNIINKETGVSQVVVSDILRVYKQVSNEWLVNGIGKLLNDENLTNDVTKESNARSKDERISFLESENYRMQKEIDILLERITELKEFNAYLKSNPAKKN